MTLPCSSSPATLGVIRAILFGCFFVQVACSSVWAIGYLPVEIMHPPGIMQYLSWAFYDRLITPSGMLGLQVILLVSLGAAAIGVAPSLSIKLAAALMVLYQGILRSFGHFNHDEMVALISLMILACVPCCDAFSIASRQRAERFGDSYVYGFPILLMQAVLAWSYFSTAMLKFTIGRLEYFSKDSLPILCLRHSLGNLHDTQFRFGTLLPAVRDFVPLAVWFAVLWELTFPLAIFLPRAKWIWLGFGLVFHLSTLLLMNITFPWQVLMYAVFVDWSAVMASLRRRHPSCPSSTRERT